MGLSIRSKAQRGSDEIMKVFSNDKGAVVVEFMFALLFLFLFFIAFAQMIQIYVAHERLSYAAFAASRAYSVHGNYMNAANAIESGAVIKTDASSITLEKDIDVPINFEALFREGGTKFRISKTIKTFREPVLGGDN